MSPLKKSLKLWDIVAICVGAMFSSGFFLLPGLAFAHTGPSVFLAYIVSGFLILPSMLSQAELSTAMPKAGGSYFFLDRAFGPVIGTIGGLGTFIGLVLKTAFALIGFGAYLQLYIHLPIKTVAAVIGVIFIVLNLVGAKESSRFQKILVSLLIVTMVIFIMEGLRTLFFVNPGMLAQKFDNFFANGMNEFFYTIAFVFVSYAGLTKVASVAEEVENPDRNIPLGMAIGLILTVIIYGLGVFVVVGLVPPAELMYDLKPIATAEGYAFNWVKGSIGLILVTLAALSAFASTGNAGILASSRYPLAMAKDKLIPEFLSKVNRFGVPVQSILFTGSIILLIIFTQSEEGIAKLASAFQLLLFIFINTAVIVMRESNITTYDPGFKSPFYPWTQIFGIVVSFALLIYMGTTLLSIMLLAIFLFFCWFYFYASKRVVRRGAILHWFANLGKNQFDYLEEELWNIMKQKGIRENDPVQKIIDEAYVISLKEKQTFSNITKIVAEHLEGKLSASADELNEGFLKKAELGAMPISHNLCMAGLRLVGLDNFYLVIVRCPDGFSVRLKDVHGDLYDKQEGNLALFLVSPERKAHLHLRLMANWIYQAENNQMVHMCMLAKNENAIKNTLAIENNHKTIEIKKNSQYEEWIDKEIKDIDLPDHSLIIIVIRENKRIIPDGKTVLKEHDIIILLIEHT